MLYRYRLPIVLLLLGSLPSGAQERPRIMPSPQPDIAPTHADQVYREAGSRRLHADVYLPDSVEPTAAIAWFPGGAFRQRNKRWIRGSIFDQLGRGVAVISFEYTLGDEAKWPAQAHDGKAAVRWVRGNARKFNIDPERIFIAGSSAGALIANVVAMSPGHELLTDHGADDGHIPDTVSGVIAFYGAGDMTTHGNWPGGDSAGSFLTGCASLTCRPLVEGASPVNYVSPESPPALLFHGMGDVVIDYRQSVLLQEKLNEAGVDAQLILRTDLVHGDARFDEAPMTDLITSFLSRKR